MPDSDRAAVTVAGPAGGPDHHGIWNLGLVLHSIPGVCSSTGQSKFTVILAAAATAPPGGGGGGRRPGYYSPGSGLRPLGRRLHWAQLWMAPGY